VDSDVVEQVDSLFEGYRGAGCPDAVIRLAPKARETADVLLRVIVRVHVDSHKNPPLSLAAALKHCAAYGVQTEITLT
jgi:hypothetical protein